MKRLIATTIFLVIATVLVTVLYFKNLSPPGVRTGEVMHSIPANAVAVFQFNNEKGFYDIFNGSQLLKTFIGGQHVSDLDTLRKLLIASPQLSQFFSGQNLFISLHPANNNDINLLITTRASKTFDPSLFTNLTGAAKNQLQIKAIPIAAHEGFDVLIKPLDRHFYILKKGNNIFSGSFSKDLIEHSAIDEKNKNNLSPLPEQQNANSLAELYVNYTQLDPLFNQLFENKNTDIFKSFRLLPGLGALTLNYKSDALMFNGFTKKQGSSTSYLNLFSEQQPIVNHLKDIFPATTAYSMSFAVSNAAKFTADLASWQNKAGVGPERDQLLADVKANAGLFLKPAFDKLLGNEFAVVTTRYFEKFAIVSVKDGAKLQPLMMNISNMVTDKVGQFNYNKLPFFLLGDAFSVFRKPYFIILDNYLVLAGSVSELESYYDTYINRKFIGKTEQFTRFDNLLAERSNVAFFMNFKNTQPVLKRDLKQSFYSDFENAHIGWKNYYGAAYQLAASDKNFYTNFCMQLSVPDTSAIKN
ncbi:hypothetical protein LX99_03143 [Mucilaginibacter oryzae]|uniref:DUF3352 domain-containing protein n=1 Tax=Mucilaginibacter oryzae TaxID=468058 RepID=A0A316HBB3_9SPHI|nr:hypothetical protein [Mucilaginibacter oryzae]PWK77331.1 hypothetical protein LX99_03143 [Mucilaginibacter oryzae]